MRDSLHLFTVLLVVQWMVGQTSSTSCRDTACAEDECCFLSFSFYHRKADGSNGGKLSHSSQCMKRNTFNRLYASYTYFPEACASSNYCLVDGDCESGRCTVRAPDVYTYQGTHYNKFMRWGACTAVSPPAPPTLSASPAPSVTAGSEITLTATGAASRYLFFKDSVEVSAGESPVYHVDHCTTREAGAYHSVALDGGRESLPSNTVHVTVDASPPACDDSPCVNGGQCEDLSDGAYTCFCINGNYGKNCEHETDCREGHLSGPSGAIQSPKFGTGDYPGDLHCLYRITVSEGRRVKLTFTDFDLEPAAQCRRDQVKVFDSSGSTDPLTTSCGNTLPGPFSTSAGNEMVVIFTTDRVGSGAGFRALWEELL